MTDPTQQGREAFEKDYTHRYPFQDLERDGAVYANAHALVHWATWQQSWQAQQSTIDALNKRVEELEGALRSVSSIAAIDFKAYGKPSQQVIFIDDANEIRRIIADVLNPTPVASHE